VYTRGQGSAIVPIEDVRGQDKDVSFGHSHESVKFRYEKPKWFTIMIVSLAY